ncbi:hypothetical protein AAON49_12265 [Pseudotenacibaculum sp. MALMAid0570]
MKIKTLFIFCIIPFLTMCSKKNGLEENEGCGSGLKTYYDDITFTTQKELDDFDKLGYTSIIGGINIIEDPSKGDPIMSLNGLLDCVTYIEGGIIIRNNSSLESLNGFLINLTSVNHFFLDGNENLTSLGGFDSLISIEYNVTIRNNRSLINFEGFCENVDALSTLSVINNHSLINLEGLQNVNSIGTLNVIDNQGLLNLNGLDALTNIISRITISNNSSLLNIDGLLSNLNNTLREVSIDNNSSLKNIRGLTNISTLESLLIFNNDDLLNLEGLENLNYLNQFTRSGISVSENDSLENIDALSNLIFVNYLDFHNNLNLSDFCGIKNLIDTNSYVDISILGNLYNPSVSNISNGQCN